MLVVHVVIKAVRMLFAAAAARQQLTTVAWQAGTSLHLPCRHVSVIIITSS